MALCFGAPTHNTEARNGRGCACTEGGPKLCGLLCGPKLCPNCRTIQCELLSARRAIPMQVPNSRRATQLEGPSPHRATRVQVANSRRATQLEGPNHRRALGPQSPTGGVSRISCPGLVGLSSFSGPVLVGLPSSRGPTLIGLPSSRGVQGSR